MHKVKIFDNTSVIKENPDLVPSELLQMLCDKINKFIGTCYKIHNITFHEYGWRVFVWYEIKEK